MALRRVVGPVPGPSTLAGVARASCPTEGRIKIETRIGVGIGVEIKIKSKIKSKSKIKIKIKIRIGIGIRIETMRPEVVHVEAWGR